LTFEILERASAAVAVDASAAYVAAAREEAGRRVRLESTSFVHGDFVAVAGQLPVVDTVTLDRVVCCYPEHRPLLELAVRHATHGFAFSYPRERWFVSWVVRLENGLLRLRSNPFRTFVHPEAEMERILRDAGFERVARSRTVAWSADVYSRPAGVGPSTSSGGGLAGG
jgi:magnesium-protoporphyrin O-methyltransferase